jgi:hypothetical protein
MGGSANRGPEDYLVSILVFVELALDVVQPEDYPKLLAMFQSLFSWNLLLMSSPWGGMLPGLHVSILVFVELALDEQLFFVLFLIWPL